VKPVHLANVYGFHFTTSAYTIILQPDWGSQIIKDYQVKPILTGSPVWITSTRAEASTRKFSEEHKAWVKLDEKPATKARRLEEKPVVRGTNDVAIHDSSK